MDIKDQDRFEAYHSLLKKGGGVPMGPSAPLSNVFANGTDCPHTGCKYNHSREAMVARVKQLWLDDARVNGAEDHLKKA